MMKYLVLIALFVFSHGNAQDLKEIRSQYTQAAQSNEAVSQLEDLLLNKNLTNSPVLMAYKGAVLTLKAKFSKSKQEKKDYFKEGVSTIESAIRADSSNIEIRYIRLSVQENSPRFLGYHKNIQEDRDFIIANYSSRLPKEIQNILKDYVLSSESFDENQKSKFKKA